MTMEDVKPCPFCGKKDNLGIGVFTNPFTFYDNHIREEECAYLRCWGCGVVMKERVSWEKFHKYDDLIRKWNRRMI